ncbi:MAG: glycine cleavage system protein GcvH [Chloroflexi bacterium]|nr:glycine cleavage system protein GcvH [Chloroflexota bacterium]MCL5110314.1 glycine cleavage system protein GcvH [Chloroflexota bacterium]
MVPKDLKYSKEHEWVRTEGDVAVVGITDFAQSELGDVVFLELPKKGDTVTQYQTFGVVESVKAASDLYAPVTGEVIAVNDNLLNEPEIVNKSPYEDAWMLRVKMSDPQEVDGLLSAEDYEAFIAG